MPYLSFKTFSNFLDELGDGRPVPPRVDRSLMAGMAGGTQTQLMSTLEVFKFIDSERRVTKRFVEVLEADPGARKAIYRGLLNDLYHPLIVLSAQQGTADQLAEEFKQLSGYGGSTLRKGVTFFLHLARAAEVELSPYFRPPPQTPSGTNRARRVKKAESGAALVAPAESFAEPAESKSVQLASGGRVTITSSVKFFALDRADRDFVFTLVDMLADYEGRSSGSSASGSEGPGGSN